jgi:hypothetical protein
MKILQLSGFTPPDWHARLAAAPDYGFGIACDQAASPLRTSAWLVGEKGSVKLLADATGSFHSFSGAGFRNQPNFQAADYDLPKYIRMGLPAWEEAPVAEGEAPAALKYVVYEQDPVAGDIVIDWSGGAPSDAVLLSPLEHDIWLCCHYQMSTQRWVGLSLRNMHVTIMNDCSLFGGPWSRRTSLQTAWRRLLETQAAE